MVDLQDHVCYVCEKEFNPWRGYALDLQLEEADEENIPCKIRHITCEKKIDE